MSVSSGKPTALSDHDKPLEHPVRVRVQTTEVHDFTRAADFDYGASTIGQKIDQLLSHDKLGDRIPTKVVIDLNAKPLPHPGSME